MCKEKDTIKGMFSCKFLWYRGGDTQIARAFLLVDISMPLSCVSVCVFGGYFLILHSQIILRDLWWHYQLWEYPEVRC